MYTYTFLAHASRLPISRRNKKNTKSRRWTEFFSLPYKRDEFCRRNDIDNTIPSAPWGEEPRNPGKTKKTPAEDAGSPKGGFGETFTRPLTHPLSNLPHANTGSRLKQLAAPPNPKVEPQEVHVQEPKLLRNRAARLARLDGVPEAVSLRVAARVDRRGGGGHGGVAPGLAMAADAVERGRGAVAGAEPCIHGQERGVGDAKLRLDALAGVVGCVCAVDDHEAVAEVEVGVGAEEEADAVAVLVVEEVAVQRKGRVPG